MSAGQPLPLDGVRVVEAGLVLAGPFCGSLLADLGAEVVKIERPDGGDPARLLGPQVQGEALWWGVAARDKRCVTLDLKAEGDRARFLRLIEGADVFVENYRPGVLQRLGLDWESLHARNPRLVMVSVSGYGQTGPEAGRPGFGKIAEGLSGIVPLTGAPDRLPLHVGFSLADTSAGLMGAMGVAMALWQRDCRGGRGAYIDVALYEPLLRMAEMQAALLARFGTAPVRQGSNDPYGWGVPGTPARRFVPVACADGEVLVLIDAASRAAVAALAGVEAAASDAVLGAGLAGALAPLGCAEAAARLRGAGIEAARIHDGASLAREPYFRSRGDVETAVLAGGAEVTVSGHLPRREGTGRRAFRAAGLGADNAAVFGADQVEQGERG